MSLIGLSLDAHAQFSTDWGTSSDNGHFGFDDLGKWFSDNGFAPDPASGAGLAKTGYIGFGAGDSDPYFFSPGNYTFEVVQRIAGNASLAGFGYYTGTGLGKSLTGVLANGVNGPASASPSSSFGLYTETPKSYLGSTRVNWFTDRSENEANQTGSDKTNSGGDPQALIYSLGANEWLVAWEDLDYTNFQQGQSDRDFNDAFLKISSTTSPEPASFALFGLGGGALVTAYRRRRKK